MLDLPSILNLSGGPVGLFIGSFLASTLLPGGSEAMLVWELQQHPDQAILLCSVATLGNTLGGLSSWLIGWWLGRRYPGRGLSNERQRLALKRVTHYGSPILLLSWLPVIGDPLCLAAGWSGVRLLPATLFIGLGKALRYGALAGAMGSLG
ncbi:YqaA family protein [Candidatus Thiodiazotropha sp. CDECU1]|uniref:YqaA family protein n=1 Tax=Candidatus Thiodiazotropha sp. CDECU1 TaxID=3065865 RepID=UPI0029311E61|nr:YqaA family protein [Candidatus Thiodiazotropha sp. CDECU1]